MRRYTPEQIAARNAYTREWRKRNKDKIQAWEQANRLKRNRQRVKLKRAKRDLLRAQWRAHKRKHRAKYREASRAYRARKLALNPNFYRDRNRQWAEKNPTYARIRYQRDKLRRAWRSFAFAGRA